MSEQMVIENKRILILGNEYRLSIIKTYQENYEALLSDYNSSFVAEKTFYSYEGIAQKTFDWIKEMNACNDPELREFEKINQWDGVVRT